MSDPSKRLRLAKIGALVAAGALVFTAHRLGLFDRLGDPTRLKETLVELGPIGWLAFVAAYTILQPFGIPGTVFVIAASLIWPWELAFALSMIGTMGASVVGFSFARFVARDWVARIVPQRFRKYDDALARRGLATVFLMRLVFWMPPLLHAFFGVSKVRFWTHFWGSLAGYVVPLLLMSLFGERLFDLARRAPPHAWVAVGVAVVGAALAAWALRRRVSLCA